MGLVLASRWSLRHTVGLAFKRYNKCHALFKNMASPTGQYVCLSLMMCFQRILDKNQEESFENSLVQNNCIYLVSSHCVILKNNE